MDPHQQALSSLPSVLEVAHMLWGLTQPDTAMIRQAESALKPVLKQPAAMMLLWQILEADEVALAAAWNNTGSANTVSPTSTATAAAVRQITAIVLRKRLPSHYCHWDVATQQQWQQRVLHRLAMETVRPVRQGLIGLAAALAQVDQGSADDDDDDAHDGNEQGGMRTGTVAVQESPYWQFLVAATQDPSNAAAHELCFLLLAEMSDTVGLHWRDHIPALQQLFAHALMQQTGNSNATVTVTATSGLPTNRETMMVQKAAVAALGQLMSFWRDDDDEIAALAPLLPPMLAVAQQAAASHDEDFVTTVLDVLYDLAFSAAPALQDHMPVTVSFSLQCLQNTQLELRVRDAAALVIATTAEAKPKTFGRNSVMLGAVLDVLFQLMQDSPDSAAGALFESNPAWRQDLIDDHHHHHADGSAADVEDDDDSPTETSMAQGTLDMLACEIPKKYIWPAALQRCLERMQNTHNAAARKAGVAGLGVIAEGCFDPLTAALPQVLPHVLAAAQDPASQVRECACFCLGQFSEHCQPDILQYSAQILPIVFHLLDDGSVAVQATSCYVLEMFCERLEPTAVRPLLDRLVRKLAQMLEKQPQKRSVQEMAVAALAATAVAAEEDFIPYVHGVAQLMTPFLQLHDTHLYSLRGRALECMGHMAIAVGRDTFRPYFVATMQCAMEGLSTDSTDLQEFAYAVFANLAKVMGEEFAPALPDLVPHLIKVIEQDEGQLEAAGSGDDAGHDGGSGDGGASAALAGLDDSDDEDEQGQYVLQVRTALLEVKKGAITALGEMAAHTGTSFCPHLEACMQVLQKAAVNWHPLIKCEAADAFPSLIVPSIAAYHNGEIAWTKGDVTGSGSGSSPLSAHTAAIVHAVLLEELALMKDEEKSVVGKACEAIQSVIELCGPQALAASVVSSESSSTPSTMFQECMSATHSILIKAAPCQTVDAMYGEVPDDDDEHDTVMQTACDLVGAFGRVMGTHFVPFLSKFMPAIVEYSASSRPTSDRSMAMGCLSEIAEEMDGAIAEYWPNTFRPAVLAGLADSDDNVRRNAAFCAGLCCEHLREQVTADYPALLQQLGPIFALQPNGVEARLACLDNAAAAVARMIMAAPQHVPLAQVLPALLHALPLKADMTENETVYKCLLGLLQMNHPDALAQTAEMKRIFTTVLSPPPPTAAAADGGSSSSSATTAAATTLNDDLRQQLQTALQALNHAQ